MNDDEDRAPDVVWPPHTITITWEVGTSLIVDTGGLTDWEAESVLNATIDILRADAEAEAETT